MPPPDQHEHGMLAKLGAVLYFMGSSSAVQFTTKAVFTTWGFHFPLTVALLQMAFIAPVTYLAGRPRLSWEAARGLAPLAMVNVLNVVCGLIGTAGLNVPMFIALRRFTLLFTVLLERYWLRKSHDGATLSAMGVMVGGALLAAATDLTFNLRGYLAVLSNDALTSLYLIWVKDTPATAGLSTTGMLFYNSSLSLPMLGLAVLAAGEPAHVARFPALADPRFQASLLLASALGLTINHSSFVCSRVNDPVMTSLAGNLKNAVMTVVGALAFPDFIFDPANAGGLALSMAGAVWYAMRSAVKARQKNAKDTLLQQLPTIGQRDRRKPSVDMSTINPTWKHGGGGLGSHSRTNSGVDLSVPHTAAGASSSGGGSGGGGGTGSGGAGSGAPRPDGGSSSLQQR